MKNKPYKKFKPEELILRDHLAIDRTILSNESTILAYIRTSLALVAAGAALIHFFSETWVRASGGFFIIIGVIVIIFGVYRFKKMDKAIKDIKGHF